MTDAEYRVWESRLRRAAARQGLSLVRSRSRTFLATDYGRYMLVNENNVIVAGDFTYGGMNLDLVEQALEADEVAS